MQPTLSDPRFDGIAVSADMLCSTDIVDLVVHLKTSLAKFGYRTTASIHDACVSGWVFDVEVLKRAKEIGFRIIRGGYRMQSVS